jgi:glutaminyl-tRNA synthetase
MKLHSHKEKNFLEFMNPSSLQIVKDCRTKFSNWRNLERNSSFNVCYFNVDKDTVEGKLSLIKRLDWRPGKKKKRRKCIDEYSKEINKYVKEKDENNANLILNNIVDNIKSIDNYSLIIQTIVKALKMITTRI